MHGYTIVVFCFLAISPEAIAEAAYAQFVDQASGEIVRAKPHEVLVQFVAGARGVDREAVATAVSGTIEARMITRKIHRIQLSPNADPFTVAAALRSDHRVYRAFPNVLGSFEALPNDPGLSEWWFADTPFEQELSTYFDEYVSDDRVIIVLMDTGIDFEHEEFANNLLISTNENEDAFIRLFDNFTDEEDPDFPEPDFNRFTSPRDLVGHGTTMAGLIAAIPNNSEAIAGLAYGTPLWIFKVGSIAPEEVWIADLLEGLDALEMEVTSGAADLRYVVNLSLGFTVGIGQANLDALHDAVAALDATGQVIIVAATGNDTSGLAVGTVGFCSLRPTPTLAVKYPAAFSGDVDYPDYDSIIAVGGYRTSTACVTEPPDDCPCLCESTVGFFGRAEFSRYTPPHPTTQPPCISIVDLVAPAGKKLGGTANSCGAGNLYSTELSSPEDRYTAGWNIGTSYSAAITTAVVAAVWARDVSLQPAEIKFHLRKFAHKSGYNIEGNATIDPLAFRDYDWCIDPPEYCDPLEPDCDALVMYASSLPEGIFDQSLQVGAGLLTPAQTLMAVPEHTVAYITGGQLMNSVAISTDRVILPAPLTIPSGVTLTLGIGPSTTQTVFIAKNPALYVVVEGTIEFIGPVEFRSYELAPQSGDWAGIALTESGQISSAYPLTIRHATLALHGTGSASVGLSYLEVEASLYGVIFDGGGSLSVENLVLHDIGNHGLWMMEGGDVTIGQASISDVANQAILVQQGRLFINGEVNVQGSTGVAVSGAPAGSSIRDLTIADCQAFSLAYDGEDWTLGPNIDIDGGGASGIVISGPGPVLPIGPISVRNSGLHGIAIYGSNSASEWEGLELRLNGGDGLHVEGTSIELSSGCDISRNTGSGVWLEGPQLHIDASTIEDNEGNGVVLVGDFLHIADAVIKNNLNGVIVDASQDSDLGISEGDNDFSGNTNKFVVNLRSGTTVYALGNYWGSQCPPKASKFMGTVNYANCHTSP